MSTLREDAEAIMHASIQAVLPEKTVKKALSGVRFSGRVRLVSIGKAAPRMAKTAHGILGGQIEEGVVITKYGHSLKAPFPFPVIEAGHPLPDENSIRGAKAALQLVSGLREEDTVLLLLSGGGSALFELPLIPLAELAHITEALLKSGADISEINTIRKRLSGVKAGRFAEISAPARVFCIILSDVLGNRADLIASGPAAPDPSTAEEAFSIIQKYGIALSPAAREALYRETPKSLPHVRRTFTGSVRELCLAGMEAAASLGYEPRLLTDSLSGEAGDAGRGLAQYAIEYRKTDRPLAFLMGGEPVVHVRGNGLGGRSQELALSAAEALAGLPHAALFAFGSDGTDGPTDAAGGFVDGTTREKLARIGLSLEELLTENDSYHALMKTGGLLKTGPTGTNVNDLAVLLLRPSP